MPELPEVETMTARLQGYVGYRIVLADNSPSVDHLKRYLPEREGAEAGGQVIHGIFRRGKFIVFMLERGALLCHNAMSGYWDSSTDPWTFDYVEGDRKPEESDVRVSIIVAPDSELTKAFSGTVLRFHDARKFGSLRYLSPEALAAKLSKLGPDALDTKSLYEPREVMDEEKFIEVFGKSKHPIKAALMEQDRMAGVGNIYASEACWAARINPQSKGTELSEFQLSQLFFSVQAVLERALLTKLDYSELKVYRRKQCPAEGCGAAILAEELKGRKTFWCPKCQS